MSAPEHECENIVSQKRLEHHSLSIQLMDNQWVYEAQLSASQKWVEDGEAGYVGQTIHTCKLYINFCPECGKDLYKQDQEPATGAETKSRNPDANEHFCPQMEDYNKQYSHFGSSRDVNGLWKIARIDDDWILDRYAYITEQMLNESKWLDPAEIGKLHFEFGFGIVFCPFCGEYLYDYHLPTQNE